MGKVYKSEGDSRPSEFEIVLTDISPVFQSRAIDSPYDNAAHVD